MNQVEIAWPPKRNTAVMAAEKMSPMSVPPIQMGRSLECSPAPAAALVRMPTAIERPSATMKVIAAHEIAIWWAARGTAPSQPIMTVAIANAPPSKRSAPDAGRPTESIRLSRSQEKGASQRRGHAARIFGSKRSQVKITNDPREREMSVEIPAPVSPSRGAPRCP